MEYYHVDVFSKKIFGGNGLTVVLAEKELVEDLMQEITKEFRQFETIFLVRTDISDFKGRVFTMEEELPFAGHPIIGATAVIHSKYFKGSEEVKIRISLIHKIVEVTSIQNEWGYTVTMNQGSPEYVNKISKMEYRGILAALNLGIDNLSDNLPLEVVSTGLPYLLVPLKSGIENAEIVVINFEELLAGYGAKFVYVFDEEKLLCRTWDNLGITEDVATGSAAGPLAAYLVKYGRIQKNTKFEIHQGEFVGRPSIITAELREKNQTSNVYISGDVILFASGSLMKFH